MEKTKKMSMLIIGAVMTVCMLVMLTGCAGKFDAKKIAGKYDLIEMTEGEESYKKEDLDSLKEYGFTFSMELKEDGTGTIDISGEKNDLTFDDKYITIDGDKAEYKLEDNKITLEEDETKMVFEKAK